MAKEGTVTAFVIDRKVWQRGERQGELLAGDGRRCCVGIFLQACGVPDDVMRGASSAVELLDISGEVELPDEAAWLVEVEVEGINDDSTEAHDLYNVNDCKPEDTAYVKVVDEEDRERKVVAAFAKQGIAVTFKN